MLTVYLLLTYKHATWNVLQSGFKQSVLLISIDTFPACFFPVKHSNTFHMILIYLFIYLFFFVCLFWSPMNPQCWYECPVAFLSAILT